MINAITQKKFALLLERIPTSEAKLLFTSEELVKLQESLSLNEENIQLLIQSLLYIFKQTSKIILKPNDLHKQLTDVLGFNTDKADEFVKAWTSETKNHFGDFENRCKLNNISWQLNLQLDKPDSLPRIRMQLDVSNFESNKDNIILELNEDELINLYNTIENIQGKLDKIQN